VGSEEVNDLTLDLDSVRDKGNQFEKKELTAAGVVGKTLSQRFFLTIEFERTRYPLALFGGERIV
jgi:hypothetical protein